MTQKNTLKGFSARIECNKQVAWSFSFSIGRFWMNRDELSSESERNCSYILS